MLMLVRYAAIGFLLLVAVVDEMMNVLRASAVKLEPQKVWLVWRCWVGDGLILLAKRGKK